MIFLLCNKEIYFLKAGIYMEINKETKDLPFRVLTTEQNKLNETMLKLLLKSEKIVQIVGNFTSEAEILNILGETSVDIILLDINIPHLNSYKLIHTIRVTYPHVKIIIYSDNLKSYNVIQSMKANEGVGFIPRDYDLNKIIDVIKSEMNCIYPNN